MNLEASKFTTHLQAIPVKKLNETYYLIPFGDVHLGSQNHAEEAWKNWLGWAKRLNDTGRAWFLGMGDLIEAAATGERKALQAIRGNLHETLIHNMDEFHREQADQFIDQISFMKGRILGMLEGNHSWEFNTGITITQYICEKLKCKYSAAATFTKLQMSYANGTSVPLDLFACHGTGAARLLGGSLNRVQQLAEGIIADIYIMGHDHKLITGKSARLRLKSDRRTSKLIVKQEPMVFLRTGSFLKGYEPEKPSYVAQRGLSPTSLGSPHVELTPHRYKTPDGSVTTRVDLKAVI